jgi:hypothetical protein
MDTKILVRTKNVYGKDLVYPANEQAEHFTHLTGKKTFSRSDIVRLEAIGFEVTNLSFTSNQF